MPEYQARQNVWVDGDSMVVWEVRDLPNTVEVAELVNAGYLVARSEDGSFPDPVAIPWRCCGGR